MLARNGVNGLVLLAVKMAIDKEVEPVSTVKPVLIVKVLVLK